MSSKQEPQPRALVVDDDEVAVDHLVLLLKKMGFMVETAPDGFAALHLCQSGTFDVIVCDVRMPKLSGLSFLTNLGRTKNATSRVVMISAFDDNSIRDQALASGAAAYLVKPIGAEELRDAVGGVNYKP
jgi:DNA-binding response OmpR family regulator